MISNASSRRQFVKATAGSLALPVALPVISNASVSREASPPQLAKRLVCIGAYLGYHQPSFFPQTFGRDYVLSPTLEPLTRHRGDFTVFSGLDHGAPTEAPTEAPKGHGSWSLYLTGASQSGSLDQRAANAMSGSTPLASLELGVGDVRRSMSFDLSGQPLSSMTSPRAAVETINANRRQGIYRSIEAASGDSFFEQARSMYDAIVLALATDTTRVASLNIGGMAEVFSFGGVDLSAGYHALTHHSNDPAKIAERVRIDREHVACLARFLDRLKSTPDTDGRPLLDSTIVLFGTGIGDANTHGNRNLPTLVAGGGWNHGQHVDAGGRGLSDLFATILDAMGNEG